MSLYDGKLGESRGSDSGSLSAVVSQDWNFSRRVSFFHLAAPNGSKRCPHAAAQEESSVVPLEETLESEEETPKKELGAQDPVLSGSIDRLRLQRAVDALPPGYRRIFVLHDVEGYEHNEIAAMVGCSIGNSKSQLHKARMKLRESLKTSRAEKAATKHWGEMKYELCGV